MKKHRTIALIVLALAFILVICASEPIIIAPCDLPSRYLDAIRSQSGGIYSQRLPLIPLCVSVGSFSDESVYYTIHYLPFGTVDMSYTAGDGYNMEKPLIRS